MLRAMRVRFLPKFWRQCPSSTDGQFGVISKHHSNVLEMEQSHESK